MLFAEWELFSDDKLTKLWKTFNKKLKLFCHVYIAWCKHEEKVGRIWIIQPLESFRNLSECLHQTILTEQNSFYFFNKVS